MKSLHHIFCILLITFSGQVFSQENIGLLILNKKYDQALEAIALEYSKNPSAELSLQKGSIYKLQHRYQKAAEAFFTGTELDPKNAIILGELAETLTILDNYSDAAEIFRKALALNPDNLTLAGKLGATYINLKDYKSAFRVFEEIYGKDTTNIFWNIQYAFCVAKTRAEDSLAIRLYEDIMLKNPRDISLYTSLYTLYMRGKNELMAENVLTRGLGQFPGNTDIQQKLGNFYFGNKNYKMAAASYKNYLDNSPGDYEAMRNYGVCLYFNKSETVAIEILEECQAMVFNDPIVLFYLSLSHKKLANYKIAEDYMNAAIEAATPSYLPEMYHHLGQIYGQQRKFEESIGALKESYSQDTTSFEILFEIATTYEEYNFNKTLALNYYRSYLKTGGERAKNSNYALTRIERIKEDLFFEE